LATPLRPSARSCGEYLGEHFASRDPLHLARWSAALAEGRARKRCSAMTKTGLQCRQIALRFAVTCGHHTRGQARDEIDALRLGWLRKQALRYPALRAYAERSIERIFIRRLLRAWRLNPELPGATMRLGPVDEARVERWLIEHGVNPKDQQHTAQCVDKLRWAAFLSLGGKLDDRAAQTRIGVALRGDERWRARQAAAKAA
jgi:hypothetical protein